MRALALGLLALAATLRPLPASSQPLPAPDTIRAQFLFVDGDRVFLRALETFGPNDSLWIPGLGAVVEADPPILRLAVTQAYFVHYQMGDTLSLLRRVRIPQAENVGLVCDTSVWDPLGIASATAYAAAPLFHRGLFRLNTEGRAVGDLALTWQWKGFDLFVVIDTTVRFGDGTPVDAYAVKSSLERYFWYRRDVPSYSWQYAIAGIDAYRSGRVNQVLGLIPRSRDTLQFNLARPLYDLPGYLALPELAIVKWRRDGVAAPVTATAGYYSTRTADTVFGRAPSGGWILLRPTKGAAKEGSLIFQNPGGDTTASLFRSGGCPVPRLLMLCPRSDIGRQLLTFAHFAVDCDAVKTAADAWTGTCADSFFPDPTREAGGRHDTLSLDLARAKEARALVRGSPSVRIAAAPSVSPVAGYLVDAFKAWNLRAALADTGQPCDFEVRWWDYGLFFTPLYAERSLGELGRPEDDSLVALLQRARQLADDTLRAAAYRSLLTRITDDRPCEPLLQSSVRIEIRNSTPPFLIAFLRDEFGRPLGPIVPFGARQ